MVDLLQYTFFQHALMGCVLAGVLCGLVGTYIVTRRMVFIAGGIGHASLGGVGLGALLGFSPIVGAACFSLLTAFGVQGLIRRREVREDSAVAMLWALGMSVGIICAYLSPAFLPHLSGYLFGNVLLINTSDLIFLGLLTLVTLLFFILFLSKIMAIAFDAQFARAQKLPVRIFEYTLMALVALSVVACLRIAGVVMVISLLSVPQMTANLISSRFVSMMGWSVVIGIFDCLVGLAVSYWLNIPSGATIIVISIAFYGLLRTIKAIFFGFSKR